MKLQLYPAPVLLQKCNIIPLSKKERSTLRAIIQEMYYIMRKYGGVGLAAPQIGISSRLFVWNHTGKPSDNCAIINPILLDCNGQQQHDEQCISLPGVTVSMKRATSSKLIGLAPNGIAVEYIGDELLTRIWSHEIDHLDGKLIIDSMTHAEHQANKTALQKLLKSHH